MIISECCGAKPLTQSGGCLSDICSFCGEHADFIDFEDRVRRKPFLTRLFGFATGTVALAVTISIGYISFVNVPDEADKESARFWTQCYDEEHYEIAPTDMCLEWAEDLGYIKAYE